MWHTIWKSLMSRKRRLVGTSLAVVLGVAFLAATLTLGDTLRAGFDDSFALNNAGTAVAVRNSSELTVGDGTQRGDIDASLAERIAGLDGVRAVAPEITGTGQIVGSDGDPIGGEGPPTSATNWITDAALNPWELAEGRAPRDVADGAPYEVVIDRGSADTGELAVGDNTVVLTPQAVDVVVTGIATIGGNDSLAGTNMAAFTERGARDAIGAEGRISSLLVASSDGIDDDALRDAVAQQLPTGIEAVTGEQLTAESLDAVGDDFLDMFEVILLSFAGVALVVSAFSIHNTFSIQVAQRSRESALLRALGASRRQVLVSVSIEALLVGLVASVVGLAGGYGLAIGLRKVIGIELTSSAIVMTSGTIVVSMLVGIVTAMLASIVPAIKASRVAPLAALRDVAVDDSGSSRIRAVIGALLTAAGIVTVVTASSSSDGALGRAGLGSLATLVGAVVLGPVVARPVAGLIGGAVAVARGHSGRLARRNAVRNPRRTAGTASALMVGAAVVTLFTTFGASIKATLSDTVNEQFGGDLVISSTAFSGSPSSPELRSAIAELDEVDTVAGIGLAGITIDGRATEATYTDPAAFDDVMDLGVVDGSFAAMTPGQVAVSTQYAEDHRLGVGDTLDVGYLDGASDEAIVAATYDVRTNVGDVVITDDDWTAHDDQAGDVAVLIDLAPGVSETAGQAAVERVSDRFSAPEPETRDEYLDSVGGQVDQMLTFVYGLLGIAVLIALMGIANTLSLSIHERTRELGLLRAVGQTRRQVRTTVRWESVIVALFGTIGGVALGTFLGWGVMRAIAAEEGFGVFDAPITQLAVILVVAAGAGVVAAIRPARRAARTNILAATAGE